MIHSVPPLLQPKMLQERPLERSLASLASRFDPVAQIAWDQDWKTAPSSCKWPGFALRLGNSGARSLVLYSRILGHEPSLRKTVELKS